MSKKDKSKFKKIIKAQMIQDLAKSQTPAAKAPPAVMNKPETEVMTPPEQSLATPEELGTENISIKQVKYDLKKTAILIVILGAVIAVLYYLDLKNGTLSTFGNWLFKVLHIG